MKILINNSKKDTTPEAIKVFGTQDVIILITKEDIEQDNNRSALLGYTPDIVLIPKEFQSTEELEKSKIWETISPILNQKYIKLIYY